MNKIILLTVAMFLTRVHAADCRTILAATNDSFLAAHQVSVDEHLNGQNTISITPALRKTLGVIEESFLSEPIPMVNYIRSILDSGQINRDQLFPLAHSYANHETEKAQRESRQSGGAGPFSRTMAWRMPRGYLLLPSENPLDTATLNLLQIVKVSPIIIKKDVATTPVDDLNQEMLTVGALEQKNSNGPHLTQEQRENFYIKFLEFEKQELKDPSLIASADQVWRAIFYDNGYSLSPASLALGAGHLRLQTSIYNDREVAKRGRPDSLPSWMNVDLLTRIKNFASGLTTP